MAAVGGILSVTPFIPFGSFFTAGAAIGKEEEQRILLSDGSFANVKTFLPDSFAIFPYPRTGNPRDDAEPFRRFQLIRLAPEEGGDKNDASAFRAYSMVCVHLWCLWSYKPGTGPQGRKVEDPFTKKTIVGNIECPCHGSNYRVTDGVAIYGPASLQTPPNNVLPMLDLSVDSEGFIVVRPPTFTVDRNGIIGYGRKVKA
ncbi:MAG: Rieske 2Fe-2S domain-containing protein [Thaumarchaeota archaeon]|nr:Rieske 2Fe-2S domain-containing protein [Nitrososphaerota archaeon]